VQITEDMAERMTPEKTLGTVGCWGWVDLLYSDIIILLVRLYSYYSYDIIILLVIIYSDQ